MCKQLEIWKMNIVSAKVLENVNLNHMLNILQQLLYLFTWLVGIYTKIHYKINKDYNELWIMQSYPDTISE